MLTQIKLDLALILLIMLLEKRKKDTKESTTPPKLGDVWEPKCKLQLEKLHGMHCLIWVLMFMLFLEFYMIL
jgi:hypothetical protein